MDYVGVLNLIVSSPSSSSSASSNGHLRELKESFEIESRPAEGIVSVRKFLRELEERLLLDPEAGMESEANLEVLERILRCLEIQCPEVEGALEAKNKKKEMEEEEQRRREEEEKERREEKERSLEEAKTTTTNRPMRGTPVICAELMEMFMRRPELRAHAMANPEVLAEWNLSARIDAMRDRVRGQMLPGPTIGMPAPRPGPNFG